MAQEAGACSVE